MCVCVRSSASELQLLDAAQLAALLRARDVGLSDYELLRLLLRWCAAHPEAEPLEWLMEVDYGALTHEQVRRAGMCQHPPDKHGPMGRLLMQVAQMQASTGSGDSIHTSLPGRGALARVRLLVAPEQHWRQPQPCAPALLHLRQSPSNGLHACMFSGLSL